MRIMAFIFVFFVCMASADHAAFATAQEWKIDKAHCSFYFEIQHIYHTTRGYFEDYQGSFRFDPQLVDQSSFEFVVMTKSITTHLRSRDRHLRSDDFLDVKRFPEMRFKSSRIRRVGENMYEVEGSLTIKDVTRDITVPFKYFGVQENPFNSKQWVSGFEARFIIDRLEYHVGSGKYYQMGTIDKAVDLFVSLEMLRNK